jgi:flagellar hook-length control protein FliK
MQNNLSNFIDSSIKAQEVLPIDEKNSIQSEKGEITEIDMEDDGDILRNPTIDHEKVVFIDSKPISHDSQYEIKLQNIPQRIESENILSQQIKQPEITKIIDNHLTYRVFMPNINIEQSMRVKEQELEQNNNIDIEQPIQIMKTTENNKNINEVMPNIRHEVIQHSQTVAITNEKIYPKQNETTDKPNIESFDIPIELKPSSFIYQSSMPKNEYPLENLGNVIVSNEKISNGSQNLIYFNNTPIQNEDEMIKSNIAVSIIQNQNEYEAKYLPNITKNQSGKNIEIPNDSIIKINNLSAKFPDFSDNMKITESTQSVNIGKKTDEITKQGNITKQNEIMYSDRSDFVKNNNEKQINVFDNLRLRQEINNEGPKFLDDDSSLSASAFYKKDNEFIITREASIQENNDYNIRQIKYEVPNISMEIAKEMENSVKNESINYKPLETKIQANQRNINIELAPKQDRLKSLDADPKVVSQNLNHSDSLELKIKQDDHIELEQISIKDNIQTINIEPLRDVNYQSKERIRDNSQLELPNMPFTDKSISLENLDRPKNEQIDDEINKYEIEILPEKMAETEIPITKLNNDEITRLENFTNISNVKFSEKNEDAVKVKPESIKDEAQKIVNIKPEIIFQKNNQMEFSQEPNVEIKVDDIAEEIINVDNLTQNQVKIDANNINSGSPDNKGSKWMPYNNNIQAQEDQKTAISENAEIQYKNTSSDIKEVGNNEIPKEQKNIFSRINIEQMAQNQEIGFTKDNITMKTNITSNIVELPNKIAEYIDLVKSTNEEKSHSITIQLDPPNLGKIRLKVFIGQNNISAEMNVTRFIAKEILETQIPDIKKSLIQQNIQLSEFNINLEYDNQKLGPHNQNTSHQNRWTSSSLNYNGEKEQNENHNNQRKQYMRYTNNNSLIDFLT